ncbi:MAG: PorT family protein [Flavobacteriales bacterium]|nr:PorT family protein [Flavobacteriales bacterium]
MKKIFVLAGASLFMTSAAFAQVDIGAKAGLNYNTLGAAKGSQYPAGIDDPEGENGIGFHLGGYLHIPFSDKVGFRPEVLFSTRNVKDNVNETESLNVGQAQITVATTGDAKLNVSYIDVPLLLAITPTEGFGIHVGPVVGLRMGFKNEFDITQATTTTVNGQSSVDTERFTGTSSNDTGVRGLDLGLALGLGYEMESGLNFGVRFSRSLTSLNDDSLNGALGSTNFVKYNYNVLQVSVGYTFIKN